MEHDLMSRPRMVRRAARGWGGRTARLRLGSTVALGLALAACGTDEPPARPGTQPAGSPPAPEATVLPVRIGGGPPRFEEYPADEPYRGPPANVDLASHPAGRTQAARIRDAVARGPDFAGRYTIVSWREPGHTGDHFVIVDVATGRIHEGRADATPMEYRLDSRLIRFAAPQAQPGRVRCAGCIESYEVWNGQRLALIPPELWVESAPPPAAARELVERVRAAEQPPVLASGAPAVLRPAWDRLVLTAENGTRRVFSDEVAAGELRSIHQFAGTRDPLPAWIVVRQYVPEGRAVLMVDRRTGEEFELDEVPSPAPDGRTFATASADLVAGHSPNRVRIFRMERGGPVQEWEMAPREWGARDPVWVDGRTIRMQRVMVDWNTHEELVAPLLLRREPGGWTVQPSADHARQTLRSFLSALGAGNFAQAALSYGGSYDQLRAWNPDLASGDHTGLWAAACERSGLHCAGRAEVLRTEELSPTEWRLVARLFTRPGQPLVLGPCCGETEETMPTRREFGFRVRREGDRYLVMDLPPYQP